MFVSNCLASDARELDASKLDLLADVAEKALRVEFYSCGWVSCDVFFKSTSDRDKHIFDCHAKEMTPVCLMSDCMNYGHTYSSRSTLRRHLKSMHGVQAE